VNHASGSFQVYLEDCFKLQAKHKSVKIYHLT